MLFQRDGLLSRDANTFDDRVRPPLPTVAEPAWFAPPTDVMHDDAALTVDFHVPERRDRGVRVEVSGRNLFVWGPRRRRRSDERGAHRAMRVFALPFETNAREIQTLRSKDILRVRITKKQPRRAPAAAPLTAGTEPVSVDQASRVSR